MVCTDRGMVRKDVYHERNKRKTCAQTSIVFLICAEAK